MHTYFSFGAGVQSTALFLLMMHEPQKLIEVMGSIPSNIFFADTGAETEAIYKHLDKIRGFLGHCYRAGQTVPQFSIVSNGSILATDGGQNYWRGISVIPLFTRSSNGQVGMLRRQCTNEYKLRPLEKAMRSQLGYQPGDRIPKGFLNLWLGISVDEATRMTTNKLKWITNCYPLVELRWNRSKCYEYCLSHGWQPQKSRCFFCPYISDWAEIKRNQPQEFARAVKFDALIRNSTKAKASRPVFVHRSCRPLDEAVSDQGHLWDGFADEFENECSGHCGI